MRSAIRLAQVHRHLTPVERSSLAAAKATPVSDELKRFMDTFRGVTKELVDELASQHEQPAYVQEWVKRMVYYTVPGGKLNRGLTVLHTAQALKGSVPLTRQEEEHAHLLGWCVEWLQAFFLISDDIMDQSVTRRGQPCWYRSPHPLSHPHDPARPPVGSIAINDSFITESHIYVILRRYFRTHPCYVDLLELFHEVTYQTELGQLLDLTSLRPGRLDFDSYTIDRYNLIVKYKTAFYSFYLPVCLGLLLHYRKPVPEMFSVTRDITLAIGEYFQIQDDYLDCYGSPEQIGKIGRDIEEAKCGWLIVTALPKCTPTQRAALEANYGKEDPASVARVKQIYADLGMQRVFQEYEEKSYKELRERINGQNAVPKVVFESLLGKIYKRKK